MKCDICDKENEFVRFEGEFELNVCDSCCYELKDEDKIDKEFSEIIREDLTDEQFKDWVMNWKDLNELCEEAEEWDTSTKLIEIIKLRKLLK